MYGLYSEVFITAQTILLNCRHSCKKRKKPANMDSATATRESTTSCATTPPRNFMLSNPFTIHARNIGGVNDNSPTSSTQQRLQAPVSETAFPFLDYRSSHYLHLSSGALRRYVLFSCAAMQVCRSAGAYPGGPKAPPSPERTTTHDGTLGKSTSTFGTIPEPEIVSISHAA